MAGSIIAGGRVLIEGSSRHGLRQRAGGGAPRSRSFAVRGCAAFAFFRGFARDSARLGGH